MVRRRNPHRTVPTARVSHHDDRDVINKRHADSEVPSATVVPEASVKRMTALDVAADEKGASGWRRMHRTTKDGLACVVSRSSFSIAKKFPAVAEYFLASNPTSVPWPEIGRD